MSLISFPPGRAAGLPPARKDLHRIFGELAGLGSEDKRLSGFASHLEADVAKASAVEAKYQATIDSDANLTLQRLRDGLVGALDPSAADRDELAPR